MPCKKKSIQSIKSATFFLYSDSFFILLWLFLLTAILSLCNRMEFLNDAAFEENSGSQEFWLSPLPGATKYIPLLDLQTQGLQMFTRRAASGAFPLIIPSSKGADPKQNAPSQPMPTGMGVSASVMPRTPFSYTR
jgi:hypothetical protein